jgi:hypothetical protein
MESSEPRRVLIVANRTAATPTLMEEVRRRVTERPHSFALLIPDAGSRSDHDWTLDRAVPMLEKGAREGRGLGRRSRGVRLGQGGGGVRPVRRDHHLHVASACIALAAG